MNKIGVQDLKYQYGVLETAKRSNPYIERHNDSILSADFIYGIKVRDDDLAQRCNHNLDPQYGEYPTECAAVEYVKSMREHELPVPDKKTRIVTTTSSLEVDTVATMASFEMMQGKWRQSFDDGDYRRVEVIANFDRLTRNGFPDYFPGEFDVILLLSKFIASNAVTIEEKVVEMVRHFAGMPVLNKHLLRV